MTKVADSYDHDPQREWDRLVRSPYQSLELTVYLHHITAHLPEGALVLDAGGGPGRYTIELSQRGFDVVLLDISPGLLDLARTRIAAESPEVRERIRDVLPGDVSDLSRFPDGTFDAVLCLDPLTYFPEPAGRHRVMTELVRVTRAGGLVALSVRGYLAVLRTILRVDTDSLVDGSLEQLRVSGNTTVRGVLCHFFRADELEALGESHGLQTVLMAGAQGLSEGLPDATNALCDDRGKWTSWLATLFEMSSDPTVVDMSGHMLYLGRVPPGSDLMP